MLAPSSFYEIDAVDLFGKPMPFKNLRGKAVMLVNTASLCGFSRQLKGIEDMYRDHHDRDLVVIGIPTNDFGRQEPGQNPEIATMCSSKFGVTFPYLQKTTSKGENAHPVFKWLATEGGFFTKPRWNFYKYIIDRNGSLVEWFGPLTTVNTPKLNAALLKVLAREKSPLHPNQAA